MYVTSSAYSPYNAAPKTANIDKEENDPFKGQNYILNTLDEEGNELLNLTLEGKSDQEKWMIKLSLDMGLLTEVKNNTLENITDIDNSKNSSINKLEAFIQERKRLNAPDMQGTTSIAEKFLEAYKYSNTLIDIEDKKDSIVDDFLENLYLKESINTKLDNLIQSQERNPLANPESLEILIKLSELYKLSGEEKVTDTTDIQEIATTKDVIETDKTGKMAEMQEKYKDIFMPMPTSFSQEREDLQTAIIRERYPDYLPMDKALEKYGFKADSNTPETLESKVRREEANRQFIEDHGGQEAWDEEAELIRNVFRQYPNNLIDKWHDIPNAKERANVFNAGIYESLDKGSTLPESIAKANNIVTLYLDNNILWTQRIQGSNNFFIGDDKTFVAENIEKYNNEKIIYDGYILDLREYGFDRDLGTRRIYNSGPEMIRSIQNQLDYANFIIDNPETIQKEFDRIVQKALDELDMDWTKDHDIYKDYINPAKAIIEPAELALDIFSKYKIF